MTAGAEALPLPTITPEDAHAHRRLLHRIGELLTDVGGDVDDADLTLASSWRGDAALSCTQDVATMRTLLRDDAAAAAEAKAALQTFAEAILTTRQQVIGLQGGYDDALATMQAENRRIPAQLPRFDREEWRDRNAADFTSTVAPLRTSYDGHLEDLAAADRVCAQALTTLLERLSPESMRGGAVGATPDIDRAAYNAAAFALNVASSRGTTDDADRRSAQWDAFVKTVGRPPETDSEWRTAAMLDATSYQTKNEGVPANVYVATIPPHPGRGTVRLGWFIPVHDVFNLPVSDLGDDRGFDPEFDPELTRVAVYIDYELGLVIARNNPTVSTAGDVEVGTPDINVQVHPDGRVRLFYDAQNPLAPPGSHLSGHTVHGDIVVSPDGVSGRISDYPSFEAYHDGGGQTPTTLTQDEADDWDNFEELGPLSQLPMMHEIGDDAMENINDFYRDGMDGGRHDYEWRNPHLSYPDRFPWSTLGSPDAPPAIEAIDP